MGSEKKILYMYRQNKTFTLIHIDFYLWYITLRGRKLPKSFRTVEKKKYRLVCFVGLLVRRCGPGLQFISSKHCFHSPIWLKSLQQGWSSYPAFSEPPSACIQGQMYGEHLHKLNRQKTYTFNNCTQVWSWMRWSAILVYSWSQAKLTILPLPQDN